MSTPDARVRVSTLYTAGQLSRILGVARSTANKLIDERVIHGFRLPGQRPDRRVTHGSLLMFIKTYPQFRYALEMLVGCDPADLAEVTEPAPPPTRAKPPAPRSPERPRGVRRGRIPQAQHYSLKQVGFLLGIHRRTAWSRVKSGILPAFRAPTSGPAPWRWVVLHAALLRFIARHPSYSFALSRIEGCEPPVPATDHKVGP
jgi:hypothetical protein